MFPRVILLDKLTDVISINKPSHVSDLVSVCLSVHAYRMFVCWCMAGV